MLEVAECAILRRETHRKGSPRFSAVGSATCCTMRGRAWLCWEDGICPSGAEAGISKQPPTSWLGPAALLTWSDWGRCFTQGQYKGLASLEKTRSNIHVIMTSVQH